MSSLFLTLDRRRWLLASTALASALALPAAVFAAQPPLTLAEAQRLAVERSRELAARDAAVFASREMAVAAGQRPDPVLTLGIENLPVNGPDRFSVGRDFMTMRRIGVVQELTRTDKRGLRAERFDREAEKGLAEKSSSIAAIQRDTALAWLARYYAEAMASLVAEQAEEVRLEIVAAEGAYRAGRGNQADVFAAKSAQVVLADRASEIDRRIRTSKTGLARWVGEAAEAPMGEKPAADVIRLDVRTLDTELAHHPQIAVLAAQQKIAEAEAGLARANRKSDWSVEAAYSQRGSSFSNMVSLGVSIPLQWDRKNRQDRELAAKLAMVDQAKAQRDEALRTHIAEIRTMISEWENGRERIARVQRELIPLAAERTQAALAAYRGGKAGITDVLAARRAEIDTRLQALELESETVRLWAQLNFLFPDDRLATHSSAMTMPSANSTGDTQ